MSEQKMQYATDSGIADRGSSLPIRELTPRQRVGVHLFRGLGNDMSTGTIDEQHTAALLQIACDAVERGYAGELVALVRAWAREREK